VSIFCSVRFLLKKPTKPNIFFNSEPKPIQTGHFLFGSVRLIEGKNWKNRYYPVEVLSAKGEEALKLIKDSESSN
jgi:hypothetical protein